MAGCGVCPDVVGKWIEPFLAAVVKHGEMQGLYAVPNFDREIADIDFDEEWPVVLARALAGDEPEEALEAVAIGVQLKSALAESDLAFCRLASAVWCMQLHLLQQEGCVLASSNFTNEIELDALFCPGAPEGNYEMMLRLGQRMGFRTLNRCECGELYAIGEVSLML